MNPKIMLKTLTLVCHQMRQAQDEILKAITALEDLPAARCEREGQAQQGLEEILNRLHVRAARTELAAQRAFPPITERMRMLRDE
jgi:hypothetical protein